MLVAQILRDYFKSKRDAQDAIRVRDAYRIMFNGPEGQEVLADLSIRFHVLGGAPESDALRMAYHNGQRSVVLHILKVLEDPTLLTKLEKLNDVDRR